jgi:inositol phosphorylceramide synthase catalytic subunit
VILEKIRGVDSNWERYHTILVLGFSIFYALWTAFVVEARIDHLYFYLLIVVCMLLHKETRNFALGFCFFAIFWIIYDGLRVFPNYAFNKVHFAEPYNLDKLLFGVQYLGEKITLNEFFQIHHYPALDVMTAMFYITWVPIPMALAFYFFAKDRELLLQFTACYLLTNFVGFIGYYGYPAAPPWYFAKYGEVFQLGIKPNAAGLLRFDNIIGYPLFSNLYEKNSNVFAAIPSLHSAYPVVTWFYARKKGLGWFKWVIFIDIIGIWFSAIYTNHHYVIDVLLGLFCGAISIYIFEKYILSTKFSKFIVNFADRISK